MPEGSLPGKSYSSIAGGFPGLMAPTLCASDSVNQSRPSGPVVMSPGLHPFKPYSWPYSSREVPSSVIRPILFVPFSVNQIAPSGPTVIPSGALPGGSSHSLQTGGFPGVSRPTLGGLAPNSVNHRFPSGPAVISAGALGTVGIWYSRDGAVGRDPADPVPVLLGEPERPVGAHGDPGRLAVGVGQREFRDRCRCRRRQHGKQGDQQETDAAQPRRSRSPFS